MRESIKFLILFVLPFFLYACNSSGNSYGFKIIDKDGSVIISGGFSGTDTNKDGIIEKSELETFTEDCPLNFVFSQPAEWKKSFTPDALPKITHGLKDLESFEFNIQLWKEGRQAIRFKTNTRDSEICKGYHFWRGCEFPKDSAEINIISGVGDGTQGLEMSLKTLENHRIEILNR